MSDEHADEPDHGPGPRRGARRRLRALPARVLVPAALLVGFGLAAAVTTGVLQLTDTDPGPQREDVLEYANGIEQVARAAGSVIEFEMKPALSDIAEGEGLSAGEALAEGWVTDLRSLAEGLDERDPPAGAEEAHRRFVAALEGYADTARVIARAAETDDADERQRLLDEAAEQGRASDQRWNDARDRLEAYLADHDIEMRVG